MMIITLWWLLSSLLLLYLCNGDYLDVSDDPIMMPPVATTKLVDPVVVVVTPVLVDPVPSVNPIIISVDSPVASPSSSTPTDNPQSIDSGYDAAISLATDTQNAFSAMLKYAQVSKRSRLVKRAAVVLLLVGMVGFVGLVAWLTVEHGRWIEGRGDADVSQQAFGYSLMAVGVLIIVVAIAAFIYLLCRIFLKST